MKLYNILNEKYSTLPFSTKHITKKCAGKYEILVESLFKYLWKHIKETSQGPNFAGFPALFDSMGLYTLIGFANTQAR